MASRKQRSATARQRLSPDEESARLGVSTTLILEACREGRYPHERIGRRILIDPEKADAYRARTGVSLDQAVARTRDEAP